MRLRPSPQSAVAILDKMNSLSDQQVTLWFQRMQQGDESAIARIWAYFADDMCRAARRRLHNETRPVYDEEDACQSAFRSFCSAVAAGKIDDKLRRGSLLRMLIVFASRKVAHRNRYVAQARRKAANGSPIAAAADAPAVADLSVHLLETCEEILRCLKDPMLEKICWLKIEGYGDGEIADQLGRSLRTIQRKIEVIRRKWRAQETLENHQDEA